MKTQEIDSLLYVLGVNIVMSKLFEYARVGDPQQQAQMKSFVSEAQARQNAILGDLLDQLYPPNKPAILETFTEHLQNSPWCNVAFDDVKDEVTFLYKNNREAR